MWYDVGVIGESKVLWKYLERSDYIIYRFK